MDRHFDAAVLVMIPLARSVLWDPMAYAIMGDLIVATALASAYNFVRQLP